MCQTLGRSRRSEHEEALQYRHPADATETVQTFGFPILSNSSQATTTRAAIASRRIILPVDTYQSAAALVLETRPYRPICASASTFRPSQI